MKTNSLLKLFYILFLLIGIQLAYADKLNFTFLYSKNIGEVKFDHSESGQIADTAAGGNITTTTGSGPSGSSYIVTVDTTIKDGSSSIADKFNASLTENSDASYGKSDTSHMIDLGGPDHTADVLDFEVSGIFSINNKVVSRKFYLAHTNSKYNNSPNDWWLGSLDGQIYTTANGSRKMTLTTEDGTQQYCLNQNNTNYSIIVSYGACNESTPPAYNWSNLENKKFRFEYGSGIDRMDFIYYGVSGDIHYNEEYLENVTPGSYKNGYEVTVTSQLEADSETTTSFINKFDPNTPQNNMLQMNSKDTLSTPDKLYFWVEGSLYINNTLVASDFTLGYDEHGKWWIGSTNGSSIINGIPEMQLGGYCFIIKQGGSDASSHANWSVGVNAGICPHIEPSHGFGPAV